MKQKWISLVLAAILLLAALAGPAQAADPEAADDPSSAQEAFPGDPGTVSAVSTTWNLAAGTTVLPLVQNDRGEFQGMKIDATAADSKFAPRDQNGDTQVNAGTILYIPVAANDYGAALTLTLSGGSAAVSVDEIHYESANKAITIDLPAQESAAYCAVSFTAQAYLTGISLTYSAAPAEYPGTPEDITATDTVWNLAAGTTVLPSLQNKQGEFQGMKIDTTATNSKFAPRDDDTQINAGTILYIPVAADIKGGTITVSGNNYDDLNVTLNGAAIQVGSETALPAVETAQYLKLEFSGTGSCYLTSISINYFSDIPQAETHTVTVGHGGGYDYTSVQAALDANSSSEAAPLVLLIAPGTYTEKVTVSNPWVTLRTLDPDGAPVVIEESYYSSNRYDGDGKYWPMDEYDVGTASCGTVIVEAGASNFTAVGITFQNSYNITDHTAEGEQTPAVALHTKADKVYLKDCTLLGRQDTLYVQGTGCRVYLENCLIEGTVDFVFGDADAWFTGCTLHMAAFAGRDTGYFTAPNTKKGYTGLVFEDCTLTVDPSYAKESGDTKVSLGRPWQNECWQVLVQQGDSQVVSTYDPTVPREGYENVSSAATFLGCTMDDRIKSDRWSLWTRKNTDGDTVDVTYHDTVRFAEYNSVDAGGNLLAVPHNLTLGTMVQDADLEKVAETLKAAMKLDLWQPSAPEMDGYTITLNADGGTVAPSTLLTGADGTLASLPTPTRSGYRFDGWFTEDGSAVTAETVFTADTVLYARWTRRSSGGSSGQVTILPDDVPMGDYPVSFDDVASDAWYADAVAFVVQRGIMNGYHAQAFGPNDRLSRSQLAQILYNLEQRPVPEADQDNFTDVAADSWYADAVTWARQEGIVTGYGDGTFGPDDAVTRQQLAAILCRYAAGKGYDVTAAADLSGFADAGDVDAYALDAMAWANASGILTGVDSDTLLPDGNATRAQVAVMLMRFCRQFAL